MCHSTAYANVNKDSVGSGGTTQFWVLQWPLKLLWRFGAELHVAGSISSHSGRISLGVKCKKFLVYLDFRASYRNSNGKNYATAFHYGVPRIRTPQFRHTQPQGSIFFLSFNSALAY